MAISTEPNKRKIGVHVSLDLDSLGLLDAIAERLKVSRSEAMRKMIEEFAEMAEEAAWVAEHEEAALREERVPWKQVKAELGL